MNPPFGVYLYASESSSCEGADGRNPEQGRGWRGVPIRDF